MSVVRRSTREAAKCGASFAHLVPRAVPGFSISDPSTWILTGWSEYGDRKAAADRLMGYVHEAIGLLPDGAGEAERASAQDWLARVHALPSSTWVDARPDEQLVAMAQAACEDGACVLERLLAVVAQSRPAAADSLVPSPGRASSSGGSAFMVGAVVASAVVLWAMTRGGEK